MDIFRLFEQTEFLGKRFFFKELLSVFQKAHGTHKHTDISGIVTEESFTQKLSLFKQSKNIQIFQIYFLYNLDHNFFGEPRSKHKYNIKRGGTEFATFMSSERVNRYEALVMRGLFYR